MNATNDPAGAWAWERATQLTHGAELAQAATVRRQTLRLAAGALVLLFVGWSTVAVGWELNRLRSSAVGDLLLVGFVLGSFLCGRRVIRTATRLRTAVTLRRTFAAMAATTLPATAMDPQFSEGAPAGDASYWARRALAAHRASSVLEQYAPGLTWWHDVAVVDDPAVVFDHLGVGVAGVVAVQHVVMPGPSALTVDANNGLSCGGVPITGFGSSDLMAWQLRAGSSAARAAGLPLASVTSVAVVSNTSLVDAWGAPTGVERLQHREGLIRLTYCILEQLPAALIFDVELDIDTAALAVHQLAEGLCRVADVFHRSPPAPAGTGRRGRRYELPHPEVNPWQVQRPT